MTDNQDINPQDKETPQELVETFQRRFYVDPDATVEFHLFRVIAPKGPAQPVPAQIPIGATGDRDEALRLAAQYSHNSNILVQRREWLVPKTKHGKTTWVNASTAEVRGDDA